MTQGQWESVIGSNPGYFKGDAGLPVENVSWEDCQKFLRRLNARGDRGFRLPPEALPGSLALTHRRCGKANCHCPQGQGHPVWTLTFMVDGEKRVERVPEPWVAEVRRRVEAGREFTDAAKEVLACNAQLLAL